jgi:hypothetical protein
MEKRDFQCDTDSRHTFRHVQFLDVYKLYLPADKCPVLGDRKIFGNIFVCVCVCVCVCVKSSFQKWKLSWVDLETDSTSKDSKVVSELLLLTYIQILRNGGKQIEGSFSLAFV